LKPHSARRPRGRPAKTFFHRIALHGWDTQHFTFTYKYPVLRRWLAARMPAGKRILAIGCGRGELEQDLEKLGHSLVSLDFSFAMVRAAVTRYKLKAVVQADAHVLPFRAAVFDVVILPESLGYLEAGVALREAARVLKSRGRLILTTYPLHQLAHAPYQKLSVHALAELLDRTGIRVQEQRFLRIGQNAIVDMFPDDNCDLLYFLGRKKTP
jgi:ubiquinone/menaquinone biosynthesis C-methylase UbiE